MQRFVTARLRIDLQSNNSLISQGILRCSSRGESTKELILTRSIRSWLAMNPVVGGGVELTLDVSRGFAVSKALGGPRIGCVVCIVVHLGRQGCLGNTSRADRGLRISFPGPPGTRDLPQHHWFPANAEMTPSTTDSCSLRCLEDASSIVRIESCEFTLNNTLPLEVSHYCIKHASSNRQRVTSTR